MAVITLGNDVTIKTDSEIAVSTGFSGLGPVSGSFHIGFVPSDSSSRYRGHITEVRIWKERTLEQVRKYAHSYVSGLS